MKFFLGSIAVYLLFNMQVATIYRQVVNLLRSSTQDGQKKALLKFENPNQCHNLIPRLNLEVYFMICGNFLPMILQIYR